MFALSNVFHFFTHEFASLGGWGLAFRLVFARPFDYVFFWHNDNVSLRRFGLDVAAAVSAANS